MAAAKAAIFGVHLCCANELQGGICKAEYVRRNNVRRTKEKADCMNRKDNKTVKKELKIQDCFRMYLRV